MSLCLEKPWASRPLFLGFFCFLFCREGQGDTRVGVGVGAQCVWCLQSGNSYCKDLWAHSKSRNVWQRCECLAPRQRFSGVRVEGMCNFGLRGRACVRARASACRYPRWSWLVGRGVLLTSAGRRPRMLLLNTQWDTAEPFTRRLALSVSRLQRCRGEKLIFA